jgi:hypothetical protein
MQCNLKVSPVLKIFDFVDADHPVLGGVGLLESLQLKVLVADLAVADAIVAGRLLRIGVYLAELVVGELVHEAVEELGRAVLVHAVLARRRVVVRLLDVCALLGRPANTHHPHELVYICDKFVPKLTSV